MYNILYEIWTNNKEGTKMIKKKLQPSIMLPNLSIDIVLSPMSEDQAAKHTELT
jgi:hypothetical protein